MRTTKFRSIQITESDVTEAIHRFNVEHRAPHWKKYAIERDGKHYPPKEILRMASGYQGTFPGGESTNRVFRELGFTVIEREDSPTIEDESEEALEITFKLEEDLERFLVANLGQLEKGLKLFDQGERRGQQFDAGVAGRIDILAIDAHGALVVIELKAGEVDRKVCGQIQAYMAWVAENIGSGGSVRGLIVAADFTEKSKLAASIVPGLSLKKYTVAFRFNDA